MCVCVCIYPTTQAKKSASTIQRSNLHKIVQHAKSNKHKTSKVYFIKQGYYREKKNQVLTQTLTSCIGRKKKVQNTENTSINNSSRYTWKLNHLYFKPNQTMAKISSNFEKLPLNNKACTWQKKIR